MVLPVNRQFQVIQPQMLGAQAPTGILGLPTNFLGDAIGTGFGQLFGSLFGGPNGLVDFGGGNFFQSGKGFFNQLPGPAAPGGAFPAAPGLNIGGLVGSLFGGG